MLPEIFPACGHLTGESSDPEPPQCVTWYYYQTSHSSFSSSEVREKINLILASKGIPARLEFHEIDLFSVFGTAKDFDLSGADIVTMMPGEPLGLLRLFTEEYARAGLFSSWDDYFKTEDGQALYQAFPHNYWNGTRIDGTCYGILNMSDGIRSYVVYNKSILEKYETTDYLSVDEVSFDHLLEIAEKIYEKESETGNTNFLPILYFPPLYYGDVYSISGSDGLGAQKQNDSWKVRFLMDFPDYKAYHLKKQTAIRNRILYLSGGSQIDHGNFLAVVCAAYDSESAINKIWELSRNTDDYPDGTFGSPEEAYQIDKNDLIAVPLISLLNSPYRGEGDLTCILEASDKKDLCRRILTALYTDPELSELLMYGVEGVHYDIVNDRVCLYQRKRDAVQYGNIFVVRPTTQDSSQRIDKLWKYMEEPSHPLCGFHFNPVGVEDNYRKVRQSFMTHYMFYYAASANPEAEEAAVRKELDEADLEHLIVEMEKQIHEYWENKD